MALLFFWVIDVKQVDSIQSKILVFFVVFLFGIQRALSHEPSAKEHHAHLQRMDEVNYGYWIFGVLCAIIILYVVIKNILNYFESREE